MTACRLRHTYLQYVVKKNKCEAVYLTEPNMTKGREEKKRKEKKRKEKKRKEKKRKEKKRKDYALWRQFNEKPRIIPDKAKHDQGNHLASPHRVVQDHLFLMQPECGEKPRGHSDEKQDGRIWDVVLIEVEP